MKISKLMLSAVALTVAAGQAQSTSPACAYQGFNIGLKAGATGNTYKEDLTKLQDVQNQYPQYNIVALIQAMNTLANTADNSFAKIVDNVTGSVSVISATQAYDVAGGASTTSVPNIDTAALQAITDLSTLTTAQIAELHSTGTVTPAGAAATAEEGKAPFIYALLSDTTKSTIVALTKNGVEGTAAQLAPTNSALAVAIAADYATHLLANDAANNGLIAYARALNGANGETLTNYTYQLAAGVAQEDQTLVTAYTAAGFAAAGEPNLITLIQNEHAALADANRLAPQLAAYQSDLAGLVSANAKVSTPTFKTPTNHKDMGFTGAISTGYNWAVSENFLLGLNVDFGYDQRNHSFKNDKGTEYCKVENGFFIQPALEATVFFNDVIGAKLGFGMEYTRNKVDQKNVLDKLSLTAPEKAAATAANEKVLKKLKKTTWTPVLTAGVIFKATDKLFFNVDFSWLFNKKITDKDALVQVKRKGYRITAGVKYVFNGLGA